MNDFERFLAVVEILLALGAKLPTGLKDPKAVQKLHRELEEIDEETTFADKALEAADVTYYACKAMHNGLLTAEKAFALVLLGVNKIGAPCTVEMAIALATAKYTSRAQPGNPKDKVAEHAIAEQVIAGFAQ